MEKKQGVRAEQPGMNRKGNSSNPQGRNWYRSQGCSISKQASSRQLKDPYPGTFTRTISKIYQWTKSSIKDGLEHCE